jgi:hypothetical protein
MAVKHVELKHLLESASRKAPFSIGGDIQYRAERGFHIYGELRLSLKMTAAEDTRDAQRYLAVLQSYATIADTCARETQTELLEIQGERIHLIMPCESCDKAAIDKLIAFSISFAELIYKKISAKLGDEFQGFALAADHGDAFLLLSGNDTGNSIVSLGPAANAPAKRLGTDTDGRVRTPAGHLALRSALLSSASYPADRNEWTNVNLRNVLQVFQPLADNLLTERLSASASAKLLLENSRAPRQVIFAESSYFSSRDFSSDQALKLTGFCLRADLDGFTKEVQDAFRTGNHEALVKKFASVMGFAAQFCVRPERKIIQMPWAGDCANLIILPQYSFESYEDAQMYVPAQMPAEWHSQVSGKDSMNRLWSQILGNTRWAVACAGGKTDNGSAPVILLATVYTQDRAFMVAAGWSIGRSLDALDVKGVQGTDSVIPEEDYQALESHLQEMFAEKLDSRFRISHQLTKEQIRDASTTASAQEKGPFIPSAGRHVPSPKPHWCLDAKLYHPSRNCNR